MMIRIRATVGGNKLTSPASRRSLGDSAQAQIGQPTEVKLEPCAKCRFVLRSGNRHEVWASFMCYSCPFDAGNSKVAGFQIVEGGGFDR